MLDLIISGGVPVTPSATAAADIGVAGEKIVAIGAPGALGTAGRVVDATGQIVIPGGVDPHIHCLMPIPFPGRDEDLLSAPPDQVSRATLFGGTTTLLDFVDCPPEIALQQSIEARRDEWTDGCYCDYGLHQLACGKPPLAQRRGSRRTGREIALRLEQHQKGEGDFRTTLKPSIFVASCAAELFERSKTEQKRELLVLPTIRVGWPS